MQGPIADGLRRHGGTRRPAVREPRRRQAVGRDPAGRQPAAATPELRRRFAALKRPGELVVGWMAAHLLTEGDRDAERAALQRRPSPRVSGTRSHARVPGCAALARRGRASDSAGARLLGPRGRPSARATSTRRGARRDVVLRRRGLRPHRGHGHPGREGGGVHGLRHSDRSRTTTRSRRICARRVPGVLVPDARSFVEAVVGLLTDESVRRSDGGTGSTSGRRARLGRARTSIRRRGARSLSPCRCADPAGHAGRDAPRRWLSVRRRTRARQPPPGSGRGRRRSPGKPGSPRDSPASRSPESGGERRDEGRDRRDEEGICRPRRDQVDEEAALIERGRGGRR